MNTDTMEDRMNADVRNAEAMITDLTRLDLGAVGAIVGLAQAYAVGAIRRDEFFSAIARNEAGTRSLAAVGRWARHRLAVHNFGD